MDTVTYFVLALLICAGAAAIPKELEEAAGRFTSLSAQDQQQILGSMTQEDVQDFVEGLPQSAQSDIADMMDGEDLEVDLEDSDSDASSDDDDRKDEDEGGCSVQKGEILDNRLGACVRACEGNLEVAYDIDAFQRGSHYTSGEDRETTEKKFLPRYAKCVNRCPSSSMQRPSTHHKASGFRTYHILPTIAACIKLSCSKTETKTVPICDARQQMWKALDRGYDRDNCYFECKYKTNGYQWVLKKLPEQADTMSITTCVSGSLKGKILERSGDIGQGKRQKCCKLWNSPNYKCGSLYGMDGERVYENDKKSSHKAGYQPGGGERHMRQHIPMMAAYTMSSYPTLPTEGKANAEYSGTLKEKSVYNKATFPETYRKNSPVARACLKWEKWDRYGSNVAGGRWSQATATNYRPCYSKCMPPAGGKGPGLYSEKIQGQAFNGEFSWKCSKWASGTKFDTDALDGVVLYQENLPASSLIRGCAQGLEYSSQFWTTTFNAFANLVSPDIVGKNARETVRDNTSKVIRGIEASARQKNQDIKSGKAPSCLFGERIYV